MSLQQTGFQVNFSTKMSCVVVQKKKSLPLNLNLSTKFQPFHSQDLICNSLYYLPYNSFDVSLENLVLDQLIIP